MRRLKQWAGLGYRRLESRAAAAGEALPRSTVTAALSRETLPRGDLVAAFARACGCTAEEIQAWDVARRRLAGSAPGPSQAGPRSPAQLPADLATFAGREAELGHLLNVCAGADRRVVISVIDGMAGVGKTKPKLLYS